MRESSVYLEKKPDLMERGARRKQNISSVMVEKDSAVMLPEGWIEKLKTSSGRSTKFYTNLETGQKFYSRAEVMRYVNRDRNTVATPQQPSPVTTPQQLGEQSAPQRSGRRKSLPTKDEPQKETKQSEEQSAPQKSSRRKRLTTKDEPLKETEQPVEQSTPRQLRQRKSLTTKDELQKETKQPLEQSTPRQSSRLKRLTTKDESKKEAEPEIANEIPDWLPSGWKMEVKHSKGSAKEHKIYIESSTGMKFHSKLQVLQHLKTTEQVITTSNRKRGHGPEDSTPGKPKNASPRKLRKVRDNSNKGKEAIDDGPAELEKTDSTPGQVNPAFEWLPSGWKVKIKKKLSGSKYKYFIDPTTGSKFYSKPEVMRHLNAEKSSGKSSSKKIEGGESSSKKIEVTASHKKPKEQFVIERGTPDKLPSGWIKEVKIEKRGNGFRKDPFYTDPVSGYVFRSQNDALLYINTGDINMCAIKPKKRDELDWLSGNISPAPAAVGTPKSQVGTTKRGRSEGGKKKSDINSDTLESRNDNGQYTKRQHQTRYSTRTTINEETLTDNTPKEKKKKKPITPKKSTSSRKRAKTENPNPPPKSPINGKRKKKEPTVPKEPTASKEPTPPSRPRRITAQFQQVVYPVPTTQFIQVVYPVPTEPIHINTVPPNLAETLNNTLGIDLSNGSEHEIEVENSPRKEDQLNEEALPVQATQPSLEETLNLNDALGIDLGIEIEEDETTKNGPFNLESSWNEVDIKDPEPEPEPTWILPDPPVVQDKDLGAQGFPSDNHDQSSPPDGN